MASSTKKQKVQDSKCSREFQTWWAEKYGMINKGDKAVCVLCSGTVECRTSSVKRHFETNLKSFCEKSEPEQKELIASAIKDRNKQSTSMFKYVSKNCHTSAASYSAANAIARHGKPFQEGEFLKEAWLTCASSLFDDFDNKDKIIQRIKDVPLSRNTMKDRILKLAENGHSILECHCTIHQQALCAKSGLTSLDNVITLDTKIVNLISSQALNKRKFDALLDEVNSVYNGLVMYNNVRWLSHGNVLQRFVDCLEEIRLFLQNESKIEQYPQLMDIMWLLKLMFFTDICQHFNELDIKFQGPNKTVIIMMDLICAFEAKLYVFRNDIITKNYKYFTNMKKKNIKDLDAQEKRNEEKVIDDFISIMDSLIKEFSARFSRFKELSETFKFIMYPDVISFDKLNLSQFDWLEIEELEMQLIDFQSSSIWIQKLIETRKKLELIEAERLTSNISKNTGILQTWNSIPDAFNCLKKLAYAILTIFSSTYACESLFSEINNIKDSLRNRLTDDSNSACIILKVTSYNLNISYLSSNLQQQKSH
ncbi:general transcription factor II-I repeat domain-containing protein 2A [Trichonephila clavipes]|nr:general transcription factor II-I repeat domain-containing protein 2A [Trichonephila clavipes]